LIFVRLFQLELNQLVFVLYEYVIHRFDLGDILK
jgi:hypothetical protein